MQHLGCQRFDIFYPQHVCNAQLRIKKAENEQKIREFHISLQIIPVVHTTKTELALCDWPIFLLS